jgi:hypothetical protein
MVAAKGNVTKRWSLTTGQRLQVSYTVLTVAINIVSKSSSNLLPPDTNVATLTPQDIKDRVYGSKMVLVVEQMQCITIWLVKACLLLMYNRLT